MMLQPHSDNAVQRTVFGVNKGMKDEKEYERRINAPSHIHFNSSKDQPNINQATPSLGNKTVMCDADWNDNLPNFRWRTYSYNLQIGGMCIVMVPKSGDSDTTR